MAQASAEEKQNDEWKNDEFVVCLRKVEFLKNDWDLLKQFYIARNGIIPYAKAKDLKEITAICKEEFGLTIRSQVGEIGGVLIDHYDKSGQASGGGASGGSNDRPGVTINAASVYQQVKTQMEMDELNGKPFMERVAAKDIKGMTLYLEGVSPFNSNGELLTEINVNALLPLFLDDERKAENTTITHNMDEIKFDQSHTNAQTAATIAKHAEQSSQTQSQTQQNTQKLMEEKNLTRLYWGIVTICSITAFCFSLAWGIYKRPYDEKIVIEIVVIFFLGCGFVVAATEPCKDDVSCWCCQRFLNCFGFLALAFVGGLDKVSMGPISPLNAIICYIAAYGMCIMMIGYIGAKNKLVRHCRNLRCRDLCRAILMIMKLKKQERDSVSGDTETENENQNDNNYTAISVKVTNQENEKEGENEKQIESDKEHTPPAGPRDSQHDIVQAGSQESVVA